MSREDIAKILRLEDLRASGIIKPSVIKSLEIGEMLSAQKTELLTGIDNATAYEIPYHDQRGKKTKYSRWKLMPIDADLGIKYWQDEKTIPRLYLPRLKKLDWTEICRSTSTRLIITEGEKKAICACLHEMPCISVGGVWSWKAKKWSLEVIPDFDWFDWRDREVEVCYDADMYENESVSKALVALTSMLVKRGARVYVRYLPNKEGLTKLDDFLVVRGPDEYLELDIFEADSSRELNKFNEELMYVKDIKSYYSVSEKIMYGSVKALEQRYGSVTLPSESGKRVTAITEWARWPHMRMVERITYEPGAGQFVGGSYNDWRGWGAEPVRGEVGRFLDVVRSVENWEWFLQWLAYPLQNPGAKLLTAAIIWSEEKGTGKSFIGNVMRDIYGDNGAIITSSDLHDNSFVWLRNKQFVLGEEIYQVRHRDEMTGIINHIITGETIHVNEKYVPKFTLPNRANLMFTSNQPDAIHIEKGDRRFFVSRLDGTRNLKFWTELDKWRHRDGGPDRFMYYLLNQVDCSSFNPRAPAPMTEAKDDMTHTSMSGVEQWVTAFMEDTDNVIADGPLEETSKLMRGRDVFSVEQIMAMMPEDLGRSTNRTAIGRALSRLGAVRRGPTRLSNGKMVRLYAVRNRPFWRENKTAMNKWSANYEGKFTVMDQSKKRKKR